jgi:hypothetical protein
MGATRSHRQPEARLVSEFVATRWPAARVIIRARLGAMTLPVDPASLPDGLRVLAGNWRRWADALVVESDLVWVVEGKIKPNPGAVSQLEALVRLFPSTPEYSDLAARPCRGMLVFAVRDGMTEQLAAERGIVCEQYVPPWAEQYLLTLEPRAREAGLPFPAGPPSTLAAGPDGTAV